MVSYADFVTLLLAFFIVLYASSQADKAKMAAMAEAIGQAFQTMGANPSASGKNSAAHPVTQAQKAAMAAIQTQAEIARQQGLEQLQQTMQKLLEEEVKKHSVVIHQNDEGLVISLRELGFYQSGSAGLRADALPVFQRIVEELKRNNWKIRIEGNTDNVPIHTAAFRSNWELSTARATELVRLMVENYQVNPERLSAAGYGEFRPVASNDTDEGRRQNRRVDIVVLGASLTPQEGRSK
jgi:chemotaxis protein MotB